MSSPEATHKHYCTRCWNLYDCICTAAFAPESYRCPACSAIRNDAEFLRAIGVSWTDPHSKNRD